uniref:TNFR-Cys domain-containing protein n=1 Tax=Astyanax mexicanus TaxID=7994 RepID=A0A3B1JTL6_ASTMX
MKHYKDTFKINRSIKIIFLFSFTLFSLNFKPCSSACARAEYETGDEECCPMCAPGNRVYRDCTEYTSTTCVPCMGATVSWNAPNGLKSVGLRVRTACTRTSDTVCEPLQEFYCTEQHRGSCIRALKHTKCRPGEFILHMGQCDIYIMLKNYYTPSKAVIVSMTFLIRRTLVKTEDMGDSTSDSEGIRLLREAVSTGSRYKFGCDTCGTVSNTIHLWSERELLGPGER